MHHAGPDELIAVIITRKAIERGDTTALAAAMGELIADAASARRHRGAVELCVQGYTQDPRELYQIGEVRTFFQRAHREFPYWLHVCSKTSDMLMAVVTCLMPAGPVIDRGDGTTGIVIDPDAFEKVMLELFDHVNALYERCGLDDDENRALTDQVCEYITSFGA